MEDELKEACEDFYINRNLSDLAFRQALRSMIDRATPEQLEDFAETVIAGLADTKGH